MPLRCAGERELRVARPSSPPPRRVLQMLLSWLQLLVGGKVGVESLKLEVALEDRLVYLVG